MKNPTIFSQLQQSPDLAILPPSLKLVWAEAVSRWVFCSPKAGRASYTFAPPWTAFWLEFLAPPFLRWRDHGQDRLGPWPGPERWALLAKPTSIREEEDLFRTIWSRLSAPHPHSLYYRDATRNVLNFSYTQIPPEVVAFLSAAASQSPHTIWKWTLFESSQLQVRRVWSWLMISSEQEQEPSVGIGFPEAAGRKEIEEIGHRTQPPLQLVERRAWVLLLCGGITLHALATGRGVLMSSLSPSSPTTPAWEVVELLPDPA